MRNIRLTLASKGGKCPESLKASVAIQSSYSTRTRTKCRFAAGMTEMRLNHLKGLEVGIFLAKTVVVLQVTVVEKLSDTSI